jgi:hypothetical protein
MQTFEAEIRLYNGEAVTVAAYRTSTDGLIAHREHGDERKWMLTHERSGLAIAPRFAGVPTLRQAREVAASLAGITDWTADEKAIRHAPGVHRAVREAFARVSVGELTVS